MIKDNKSLKISAGGLNNPTNSITSFTYYLPDWLYFCQTSKLLL